MQRAHVLEAARKAVVDRGTNYGNPEDNFQRIANLWNTHLANTSDIGADRTVDLDAGDVAIMLGLVKIARLQNDMRHEDSWIDLAGYAACGAEVSHAGFKPDPINEALYGDGTPGNIEAPVSDEIRRECQPFYDERAMGEQLAYGIQWGSPEVFVVRMPETKFGFALGETVNLNPSPVGDKPGTVVGFTDDKVNVQWPHCKRGDIHHVRPVVLRHGP